MRLSGLSGAWATFSAGVCSAKAHVVYDPDADQPLYLMVTPANVNDIVAAKQMPIEPRSTYVFDLGYYDYGFFASLHKAGCRFVTRLKVNTPFTVVQERPVAADSPVLSDRIGLLPTRLARSRKNPMADLVREVRVRTETGKILRVFTNDLTASAQEIADLYKRRWAIELFFRWVKQTLKIGHFLGTSENAVRTQIAVALIAFMLLRLAHEASGVVAGLLAFARLIRANLMERPPDRRTLGKTRPARPRTAAGRFRLRRLREPSGASTAERSAPASRWSRRHESTNRAGQPCLFRGHDAGHNSMGRRHRDRGHGCCGACPVR